jgi:hypothetical protein
MRSDFGTNVRELLVTLFPWKQTSRAAMECILRGQKQRIRLAEPDSFLVYQFRFGSKADIRPAKSHVRFTLESGHVQCNGSCLLWANSGHRLLLDHFVGAGAR